MSSSSGWIWSEEHKDYYRYDSVTKTYIWARNTLSTQSEPNRADTSASQALQSATASTTAGGSADFEMTEEEEDDIESDDEPETIKSRSPTVAPREQSAHGRSTPSSHTLSPTQATSPFASPNVVDQSQQTALAPGWAAHYHAASNKYFYVHTATGERKWTRPDPVSPSVMMDTTPTQSTSPHDRFPNKTTEHSGARTSSLGGYSLDTMLSGGTDTSKKGMSSERSSIQPTSPLSARGTQSPSIPGLGSDTRSSEASDSVPSRAKHDSLINSAQGATIDSKIGYLPSAGIVPGQSEGARLDDGKKSTPSYGYRTEPSLEPTGIQSNESRTVYGQPERYQQQGSVSNYVATPSHASYGQRNPGSQGQHGAYPPSNQDPYRGSVPQAGIPGAYAYAEPAHSYQPPSGVPPHSGYTNSSAQPRGSSGAGVPPNAYGSQSRSPGYGNLAGYGGPAPSDWHSRRG